MDAGAWNQANCMPRAGILPLIGLALGVLACSSEEEKPKTPDGPFAVSEYFAPSGAMGDAETLGNLVIYDQLECKDRPSGAVGNCYAFDYNAGPLLWGGLYWQYPDNNWGAAKGLPVHGDKFTKVTFQAAVKEGTELLKFVIGGIGVPRAPEEAAMYPHNDQMKAEQEFTVTTTWQTFEIPVPMQAKDNVTPITELLGAFAWYANYPTDTNYTTAPPKTIYIDDLAYE